jgi:putative peptidoglycan lipid II flippase
MGGSSQDVTRRAGIVSASTLASRILGLVRESVIVAVFPKAMVDAFQTAFLIPNTFRRLTGEGSFSPSVVSVFSKIWDSESLTESQRFVRSVLGFSLMFLTALTALGVLGAEWLTYVASWGSGGHEEKFQVATGLTRLMFPYVLLISLTALAMGILNATGRFFAPAFAPVLLNVSIIGAAVGLSGVFPSMGLNPIFTLALGVLVGGLAQVLFQIPSLRAVKLLVKPTVDLKHPGLIKVLVLTGPMVIGAAAYQAGIIFNTSLAWTLPHGSVMYINSVNRLVELPLAVLVMAVSTAALPSLAALRAKGKADEMKRAYTHALRLALFVSTPAMVALVVLAEPIACVLYQRGLFTHAETLKTAAALRFAALGICSVALVRQTVPVFYAIENTRVPMTMTFVFVATHALSGFLLKGPFLHVGLCMALSLAATVQGVGLAIVLRVKMGEIGFGRIALSWMRILLATAPMAGAVHGIARLGMWQEGGNSARNIATVALAVVVGMVVFGAGAWLCRAPELFELIDAFKKRRGRK